MANLFTNIKEKVSNFAADENISTTKNDIQPRSSKSVIVGAEKNPSEATNTKIFDTSDEICVIRGIQLVEDGGNYMLRVIERLERGQLIVVDFSNSDERNKEIQFHVLWGAVMALHGSFKMLDKGGNLVLFTSNQNKIAEEKSSSVV